MGRLDAEQPGLTGARAKGFGMMLIVSEPAEFAHEPAHPLGTSARVLLTSVFGPYAQDDEFGSLTINPMELLHNQVTRVQGPFSVRVFHRSWGILFIAANISAPCTCLDFPTLDRLIHELRTHRYDVIGITGILANLGKVKKMCELIREHQPQATIVIGGHLSAFGELRERVDVDHVVRGEGVRWFRRFLGDDEHRPIRHPLLWSSSHWRVMGVPIPSFLHDVPATLIPSVGCPLGCNFCATSHMFGGKGKFVSFYKSGDELYDLMCQMELHMKVKSFFIMDENFLLDRQRALRLLELMQSGNKSWALYLFSSANALRSYTMEQLVGLGILWVWLGLEGQESQYSKLHNTDSQSLVRELQAHGIHVLGSSIIGLESHTPGNIDEAISYAIAHATELHQFMLYMPVPGTPLHAELTEKGVMLGPGEIDEADIHGQIRFNYRHPHIPPGEETELLIRAFRRDYEVNGPSILRSVRTTLEGWRRYRDHPEARIRRRFAREARGISILSAGALRAALRFFADNPVVAAKLQEMLRELYREFGVRPRVAAPIVGRILLAAVRREDRRLKAGRTLEPPTYYDRNDAATEASSTSTHDGDHAEHLRWVLPAASQ
jgi:hypothetical protein